MTQGILILCTGNICRSPMAEVLIRSLLGESVSVSSAGVSALVGRPADPLAVAVCSEHALDLTGHKAKQVDRSMLGAHGLVLVMEAGHKDWLMRRFPEARGSVYLLGHCLSGVEIPDPYGESRAAFVESLELIRRCAEAWMPRLRKL